MVPLAAEILTEDGIGEGRSAVRRSLRLGVQAYSSGEIAMALIHNMSETSLLLETVVDLAEGEMVQVDIPSANAPAVRVLWREGLLAGCEFVEPVSKAAVSAARLKSAADAAYDSDQVDAADAGVRPADDGLNADEDAVRKVLLATYVFSSLVLLIFAAAILRL
jgi:hypothetical protein